MRNPQSWDLLRQMSKTLCDWSKSDIEKHFDKLCDIVRDPRFTCRKCARSAHDAKSLCKPKKMSGVPKDA